MQIKVYIKNLFCTISCSCIKQVFSIFFHGLIFVLHCQADIDHNQFLVREQKEKLMRQVICQPVQSSITWLGNFNQSRI